MSSQITFAAHSTIAKVKSINIEGSIIAFAKKEEMLYYTGLNLNIFKEYSGV